MYYKLTDIRHTKPNSCSFNEVARYFFVDRTCQEEVSVIVFEKVKNEDTRTEKPTLREMKEPRRIMHFTIGMSSQSLEQDA